MRGNEFNSYSLEGMTHAESERVKVYFLGFSTVINVPYCTICSHVADYTRGKKFVSTREHAVFIWQWAVTRIEFAHRSLAYRCHNLKPAHTYHTDRNYVLLRMQLQKWPHLLCILIIEKELAWDSLKTSMTSKDFFDDRHVKLEIRMIEIPPLKLIKSRQFLWIKYYRKQYVYWSYQLLYINI